MGYHKEEFPALLAEGHHPMPLAMLEKLVVTEFRYSSTRAKLWKSLLFVVDTLTALKIPCSIWVDGSFLTKKDDPDDVDLLVEVSKDFLDSASDEQVNFVENLSERLYKASDKIDSFVMPSAEPGHSWHRTYQFLLARWNRDFGHFYVSGEPKGIAILEVSP